MIDFMNPSEELLAGIAAGRNELQAELDELNDELDAERERVRVAIEMLVTTHSILDNGLGDTDAYIGVDWTDDEIREEEPLTWLAMNIIRTVEKLQGDKA